MAKVFCPPVAEPLSLAQCTAWLDANLRPNDPASMLDAANVMAGLAANEHFLVDYIGEGISDADGAYQIDNSYTDHTIILHRAENYHLRANVWFPVRDYGAGSRLAEEIHAYHLAHNHNFFFLTVGYFGPGYKTIIATHDLTSIKGNPIGQKAHLKDHREVQLKLGSMIAFHAHTDVHNQIPPESLSISINLMPRQDEVNLTEQFEYDLQNDLIIGHIRGQVTQRSKLMAMLALLGGDAYAQELQNLAQSFPCPRTRLTCLQQLSRIGSLTPQLLDVALCDSSELVQQWALQTSSQAR